MGSAHNDYGPVSKETFAFVVQWLESFCKRAKNSPEIIREALGKNSKSVLEWLRTRMNEDWPKSVEEYKVFRCTSDAETERHVKFNTDVRRVLGYACTKLRFRECVQSMKDGPEFRFAWGEFPPSIVANRRRSSRIRRVAWIRVPYQSTFSDLVLLGAVSMAEELNVELQVSEASNGNPVFDAARRLVGTGRASEESEIHRQSTAFVLELAETADARLAEDTHLEGYHVVTTGRADASIRQDDTKTGVMLADAVLQCEPSTSCRKVAVIASRTDLGPGGNGLRFVGFEKKLGTEDIGYEVERVVFDYDQYRHPHALCTLLADEGDFPGISRADVLFAVSGDIAESLSHFFHFRGLNKTRDKMPKLFSADITPTLYNMMWEPDSNLEAICGVDPFFYGRLILRNACNPSATIPVTVEPTLLLSRDVREKKVENYAQLIAEHPELKLDTAGPERVSPGKSNRKRR